MRQLRGGAAAEVSGRETSSVTVRARLVAALEAIEVGDVLLCEAILSDLLEEEVPAVKPHHRCACGARFAWPGELEHHRFESHGWRAAA